jgi:hypothetical protein
MRLPLLAVLPLLAGCVALTPAEREAEQQRRADNDRALRRQHMQERGSISETEYEVLTRRGGAAPPPGSSPPPATPGSSGLPPPPTTKELEKKVETQR